MRKFIKRFAIVLSLSLVAPNIVVPNNVMVVEAAKKKVASPKLNNTKLTLLGLKDSKKLTVLNPVTGARNSWSSTNTKVATVDFKGQITPVAKGTTVIKVRIKYPNSSTQKTLSCKVTVSIPVKSIEITNEILSENAHVIIVNEKFDFNFKYNPIKPSSRAYWFIEDTDIASVSGLGVVTGKKVGSTRLKIVAAPNRKAADTSKISNAVNIRVIEKPAKTASVKSVSLASAKELAINFNSPIDASTVINSTTEELKNTIRIYENYSKDGDTVDTGDLTAKLSTDLMTLTIIPEKQFSGAYDVRVTSGVLTTDKTPITVYDETLTLVDKIGPTYLGSSIDDTGETSILKFSEPIDIKHFEVLDILVDDEKPDNTTESIIENESNFELSEDKKTLSINLSDIDKDDKDEDISVVLTGIRDLAGNYSKPYVFGAKLETDTTPKAQAKIRSIKRTSYDTLTVQYSRAIKTVGTARVDGDSMEGHIDSEDKKIVNYTLNKTQRELKGKHEVTIGFWDSYNVRSSDDSADEYDEIKVDFEIDDNEPRVVDYKFDTVKKDGDNTYKLILTFNEKVSITSTTGVLDSIVYSTNGNISPNTNLPYKSEVKDKVVTLTFTGSQPSSTGTYETTIPTGFVKDIYNNPNVEKDITFSQSGAYGTELSDPTEIEQNSKNPSEIFITFSNKLDKTSAERESNYTISGANVINAKLTEQSDKKAVVTLTLKEDSIKYDAKYPIVLNGIKGYNDNYSAITNYETLVSLKENKAPVAQKAKFLNSNDEIEITFSEDIKGTPKFNVYYKGKIFNSYTEVESATINDNTVLIELSDNPDDDDDFTIKPVNGNNITDLNGNKANIPTLKVK